MSGPLNHVDVDQRVCHCARRAATASGSATKTTSASPANNPTTTTNPTPPAGWASITSSGDESVAATNDAAARTALPETWNQLGGAFTRPKQPHDGAPTAMARSTVAAKTRYTKPTATAISGLSDNFEFNVIAYATDVKPWKSKLQESNQENRDAAVAWVNALDLAGETNIMGALDAALSEKTVDTIYLLSDGTPSAGRITQVNDILQEVRNMNGPRNVSIHTIALLGGDGKTYSLTEAKPLARDFLQKLAKGNEGTFKSFE